MVRDERHGLVVVECAGARQGVHAFAIAGTVLLQGIILDLCLRVQREIWGMRYNAGRKIQSSFLFCTCLRSPRLCGGFVVIARMPGCPRQGEIENDETIESEKLAELTAPPDVRHASVGKEEVSRASRRER